MSLLIMLVAPYPAGSVTAGVQQQNRPTQEWVVGQLSPDVVWEVRPAAPATRRVGGMPARALAVRLNHEALVNRLSAAQRRGPADDDVVLFLPSAEGRFEPFRIESASVMEPPLAAAHPEIMTFSAHSLDNPGTSGRFDLTPFGFHAVIVTSTGGIYVVERIPARQDEYIVYAERDQPEAGRIECLSPTRAEQEALLGVVAGMAQTPGISALSSGATLRTYRVAIGVTGEFTQRFGGGTVNGALAVVVSGINAVNAVLEKEAAIRLTLIANETAIIYTDPATDGYTHLNLPAMADENHTKLTTIIGAANYDLGHVFDGDAGLAAQGYAFFGVCVDDWKDRAGTIYYGVVPSHPVGLRTLLHELGHQFNAYHSFNGTTDTCSGGRNPEGAYEPGSGSSIMSYSGLCGAENVPSTTLYHTGSLEQIINYTTTGLGNSCAVPSTSGNNPPLVDGGLNYTIPASTPFVLTADGSDPDGDPVTYSWEQVDLGNAAPPNTDDGTRPLFRIYDPGSSPVRMFPELPFVLSNTTGVGQALPTTNRTLNMRVTARDGRLGGGGVSTDDVALTVDSGKGPFVVTAPGADTTWIGGSEQTVTWNVAGTDLAPIATSAVRIRLSTDNGQTFPVVLAASTPNDGSESITVPDVSTTNARISVEAIGNIFFDISNPKFTIVPPGGQSNLVVKKLATVPAGGYVLSNAAASISDTTMNKGTGASSTSRTKFYLSNDNLFDPGDVLLAPTNGRPVPVLAAAATSKQTTQVTIPALSVGTYYLIAFADADNTNSETNETDNTRATPLYIGPDLAVSKFTATPKTVAPGGSVSTTLITKNLGKVGAGATVARIYYSANKSLNTSTDTLLATINVPALGAGQTHTDTRSVTIPANATPGGRYLIALVDATNLVAEAVESPNDKAFKITVQ